MRAPVVAIVAALMPAVCLAQGQPSDQTRLAAAAVAEEEAARHLAVAVGAGLLGGLLVAEVLTEGAVTAALSRAAARQAAAGAGSAARVVVLPTGEMAVVRAGSVSAAETATARSVVPGVASRQAAAGGAPAGAPAAVAIPTPAAAAAAPKAIRNLRPD